MGYSILQPGGVPQSFTKHNMLKMILFQPSQKLRLGALNPILQIRKWLKGINDLEEPHIRRAQNQNLGLLISSAVLLRHQPVF